MCAHPLTGIGSAYLALGRASDALAPLERARALRTRYQVGPEELAATDFALARALWETGDRARARTLGASAQAGFAKAGEASRRELAEVERWRGDH